MNDEVKNLIVEQLQRFNELQNELKVAYEEVAATRAELTTLNGLAVLEKAKAEDRAIKSAGGDSKALGKNETDRQRALTLALGEDSIYQKAQRDAISAQYDYDIAKSMLDSIRLAIRFELAIVGDMQQQL